MTCGSFGPGSYCDYGGGGHHDGSGHTGDRNRLVRSFRGIAIGSHRSLNSSFLVVFGGLDLQFKQTLEVKFSVNRFPFFPRKNHRRFTEETDSAAKT